MLSVNFAIISAARLSISPRSFAWNRMLSRALCHIPLGVAR
jgi:hypothetical protein